MPLKRVERTRNNYKDMCKFCIVKEWDTTVPFYNSEGEIVMVKVCWRCFWDNRETSKERNNHV